MIYNEIVFKEVGGMTLRSKATPFCEYSLHTLTGSLKSPSNLGSLSKLNIVASLCLDFLLVTVAWGIFFDTAFRHFIEQKEYLGSRVLLHDEHVRPTRKPSQFEFVLVIKIFASLLVSVGEVSPL
mmetsp:Transcript_19780/g.29578  ORF Transcript_19780/g.29578 Transcript_19780/m.29578 type:complete len:125 (-) Transcript_19780:132-506(-)